MTRLIDADGLIEPLKEEYKKVKQAFDETSVFQAPNDVALYGALMQEVGAVIGMIEEAPTIDAEPKWIPCSEQLPEDGVYLVYAPEYRGGSSSAKEWHDGVMFAKCKNGKWSIEHGYYSRPNCVIAWMPLPEPYEVTK